MTQLTSRLSSRLLESMNSVLLLTSSLNPEQFFQPERDGRWSAAEVIGHLTMVDQRVGDLLIKNSQKESFKALAIYKRFLPLWFFAGTRIFKRVAPEMVSPAGIGDSKEDILNLYRESRSAFMTFCDDIGSPKLKEMTLNHPVFGLITGHQFASFVFYHERRHKKQLQDIVKAVVESGK